MQPIIATLHVRRNDNPWVEYISDIRVNGQVVDLSAATLKMQVRLYPGAPDVLAEVAMAGGANGVIQMQMNLAQINALPAPDMPGEDVKLAWDLTVRLADVVQTAWFAGDLIVHAGVTTPTGLPS